jgi:capsular polysaccharide biosynthesis protein
MAKLKRPAPRPIFAVLVRAWMLILGIAIAFGLATLTASLLQKPVYAATTTLYLTSGGTVASSAYDSVTSSTERVGSYAQLIYSQAVLMPAAEAVGLDLSLEEARKRVSVDVNPQVVLMTITAEDNDPTLAQRFADALAQSMQAAVSKLEVPGAASEPLVKIRQVTRATLNPSPVAPTTLVNVSVAVAVGLIAGCLVALLRESRNNKVRDEYDAEAALGAQVLTVVGPTDRTEEAFRTVRTRLVVQNPPVRRLLITGARLSASASTVTINISKMLAQAANSVVIVDANVDNPNITKWVGSDGVPGLLDVLRGASLGDGIRHGIDGINTLAVLGAGTRSSGHPADLFSSEAFKRILSELSKQFDYVIIDSAGLLEDSGGESILPSVDGVVMVGGVSLSTMADLVECRTRLSDVQARVVGLVFFEAWEEPTSQRLEEPTSRHRHVKANANSSVAGTPTTVT